MTQARGMAYRYTGALRTRRTSAGCSLATGVRGSTRTPTRLSIDEGEARMDTMQTIHIAWAKAHCPQRKAPDQCNKWRGDAPYVDAVSSVEPHTVLRNTRPLAQTDLLDPELEAAYSEAFRVWIAPPVHTQFQLRDSAAATWRQTRPDISSREHSQKWRDKFIRLAFEVLHRVLVTDPGRAHGGR